MIIVHVLINHFDSVEVKVALLILNIDYHHHRLVITCLANAGCLFLGSPPSVVELEAVLLIDDLTLGISIIIVVTGSALCSRCSTCPVAQNTVVSCQCHRKDHRCMQKP